MNGQLREIAIYRFASRETALIVWESFKQFAMELAGAFAGSLIIHGGPHQQLLKILFSGDCIALFGALRAAR